MPNPHPGRWETVPPLLDTQQSAIHACVIFNQSTGFWKVLYFTAWGREGPNNKVKSRIWNPQNNQITAQDIPDWPGPETDAPLLFCSGHSYMLNGNLLVAGGHRGVGGPNNDQFYGLPYTYVFNPSTEQWSVATNPTTGQPQKMADGRWYPTLTTLGAGQGSNKVIAMSGFRKDLVNGQSVVNKDPEIYYPDTGWSLMANPPQAQQPFNDLYPGAHLVPFGPHKGKIFYSMPMTQAYVFNPFFSGIPNGGYWEPIAAPRTTYRSAGNSVLLPLLPGTTNAKVLIIGGGDPATKTAQLMDVAAGSPSWASVPDMTEARRNANAIILPDDRILVVGGNRSGGFEAPVFPAEVYDPSTNQWTALPRMRLFRAYHSVALLLPDARIWVSGTTFPYETDIEIYSPGYLFEGTRPQIISAPNNISYGTQFSIATNMSIAAIRLVRLSVTTHAVDMDQRSIGLSFTQGPLNHDFPWNVTAPNNADVAPPGWYMLFVLRAKSESSSGLTAIPSIAKIVKLS